MVKRITVVVSDELHYKIKLQAAKEGMTISDKLREMLEKWVDDEISEVAQENGRQSDNASL